MKRIFFTIVILCLAATAAAQSWTSLKMEAETDPEYASAHVVNLLDSTGVRVSESGSGTFTIRRVALVQTPVGALQNRVIKYDYDPLTAFAAFRSVEIYKPDGTVIRIDPDRACDYAAPARSIYWGARQIMIELGRLEPGDVIDYTIDKKGFTYALLGDLPQEDERFVPPMRGEFYDIVPFWVSVPTVSKVYRVIAPKEKKVQFEFYQGECRSSVRFEGDDQIFTFAMSKVMPFEKESNMVDLYDVAPKMMMSSTPTWKEKSLWFHKVNEDYGSFEPFPAAQKKVDELLKGVTDEMERISILTHWVADNMRYSGISMGKGEGYTLHNTEMNFTDRCGVCKDKAALLISMLRMAGFEAYPAMTMAGSRIESIPADHFNHCVAVVKLSDGTYMPLDPTWVPFIRELWSSAEQQQNYLPGLPEGSDLCLTPVSDPMNHYLKIHAKSSLAADGTLSGTLTVMAEGQSDASVRRPFTTGMKNRIRQSHELELLRVSPNARLISYDAGKNPSDYQAGPISLTLKFVIPNYAVAGDGVLICKPLVLTGLYASVRSYTRIDTSEETRLYPFKDACSRYVELKETMTLPKGYRMVQEGRTEVNSTPEVAEFQGSIMQIGNRVEVLQKLSLGKRVYEAEDWPGFREAVNGYWSFALQSYVFEKLGSAPKQK